MVYCTKCGTQNEDDAEYCVKCGAPLYTPKRVAKEHREYTCFGPRERRVEEECFGLPYGGAIAGLIFGVIIILVGVAIVFEKDIGRLVGSFAIITVGLLIIAGAIYALSRR
ncbi:MAG: zinc-ribbon domain-containing protein [Thermoproteota archaeon]|nr:zinc-ribbon domain-containing protein [Thermoproteota archaeon]